MTIDGNQDFKYEVLSPRKPVDLETLSDDDILGISSIQSKNEVVRKVSASYRFFSDKYTGESSKLLYEYENDFVDDLIGSNRSLTLDIYLYNLADVAVIAQRYAFFNSLCQSTLTIKGKLNLSLYELNDKLALNLDRLYKRFGNKDRRKIGIVNKVSKNGLETTIQLSDMGNVFNRVASITANDANSFTSASDSEKIIYNFIVDNSTETPSTSSDDELYNNLIG